MIATSYDRSFTHYNNPLKLPTCPPAEDYQVVVPVTHHPRGRQVALSEAWIGTHLSVLSIERGPAPLMEEEGMGHSASIPKKERHDEGL